LEPAADREQRTAESRALQAALGRFPTRRAWLAAPEGAALARRLEQHLDCVRRFDPPPAPPRFVASAIHVVHWNVLHGTAYERIEAALRTAPGLAGADLISLNEVDTGLARSGNREVAFDLAASLGLHAAWAPLFLELGAGYRTPPEFARQPQRECLFGLALLSRWPLGEVRRVRLATPRNLLFDRERRIGDFVALVADVLHPHGAFHAVVTHLNVHGSPAGRALQMQQLLAALPIGAAIVAGDFNTTTFARGAWLRGARTLATLALAPRTRLQARLHAPFEPPARPREPLFAWLRAAGFAIEPFNAPAPSLDLRFDDLHELDRFPEPLRRRVLRGLRYVERRAAMRLDWIAARGFDVDAALAPFVSMDLARGPDAASDHAPIGCAMRRIG
jgi:endonuclease/exonuclease/phosphatase family metal-dependent hydrolase